MLYDEINETDLYGLNRGKIEEPVMYLLNKEMIQGEREIFKNVVDSSNSMSKMLDREIKSKYNVMKAKEPQFVGSGFTTAPNKSRFSFVR